MSQVMRNYACSPTQCTKIHKYWCSPLQLCNDIKTHLSWVLVHKHNKQTATHAHTQTVQSWKLRKNSHFLLVAPTDLDHSLITGFSQTYSPLQGH